MEFINPTEGTQYSSRTEEETQCHVGYTLINQTEAAEIRAVTAAILPLPINRATKIESYTDDMWETHKPRIRQLYIEEDRKLKEVMQCMRDEQGFMPS